MLATKDRRCRVFILVGVWGCIVKRTVDFGDDVRQFYTLAVCNTDLCDKRVRLLRDFYTRKHCVPAGSILRVTTTWGGVGGVVLSSPNANYVGEKITGIGAWKFASPYVPILTYGAGTGDSSCKKMTTFEAWVFVRDFLRSRYLQSDSRGSPRRSTRRFLARLSKAVGVIDASLGYADGVSGDMSRSEAWLICRSRAMRFGAYMPSPIRLRQKPFYVRMRSAVWTLDAVFGFDDKGLPFQCRYHGRLSRDDVNYGHIDGVSTQLCPHCGREAFHLFFV